MPVTNGYTTQALLKAWLGITGATYDTQLDAAVNAASRAIDHFCQRRFWLDGSVVARTFVPQHRLTLCVDDIATSTGLVLKTDASGDGTFETIWSASDYQLGPLNADVAYPEARPWTELRAVGTQTFPWLYNTWLTRRDRVQVTAKWGWPAVPDAVAEACLIKAARLFHRKDSPQGIAGFGEFGPVRLSRLEDGDVMSLLSDYRRLPVLVA